MHETKKTNGGKMIKYKEPMIKSYHFAMLFSGILVLIMDYFPGWWSLLWISIFTLTSMFVGIIYQTEISNRMGNKK